MKQWRHLVAVLHRLEDIILMGIFFSLLFIAGAQVVMRNVMGGGWLWADSALRVLVLWLAFWGASIAARSGRHIRMEIAHLYLPGHLHRVVTMVADLGCGAISATVAYYSICFVLDERQYGDTAFLNIPLWVCEAMIPLAFVLLALRFFVQAALPVAGHPVNHAADHPESAT